MDNNQLENRSYGQLISFKKKSYGYIASSYKGIVKLDKEARVAELGLDHNNTYKIDKPIEFKVAGTEKMPIISVKETKPKIWLDALERKYKIVTEKGKLTLRARIDANNDSEVVVTFEIDKLNFDVKDVCFAVEFNIMPEFVEVLNSNDKQLAIFENPDGDKLVVNGINRVSDVIINCKLVNDMEVTKCNIIVDNIGNLEFYNPTVFKLGLVKVSE